MLPTYMTDENVVALAFLVVLALVSLTKTAEGRGIGWGRKKERGREVRGEKRA